MTASPTGVPRAVPRPLLIFCAVILVVSVGMVFLGAWTTGSTWDEAYHVERFRQYLQNGWYVIPAESVGGVPARGVTDQYVYGPATMLLLHWWSIAVGTDSPGHVSVTATAYAVRHVGVGIISLFGLAAVAALGRLLFHRWAWGLVAASALAAIPMWVGHSMFNVKDVSVATGYSFVTLGLALIVGRSRERFANSLRASLALSFGTWLSLGTRPGMWPGLLLSILVCLAGAALLRKRFFRRSSTWLPAVASPLVIGLALAGTALFFTYPRIFATPVTTALRSAMHSANFLGLAAPRSFVPAHVLLEIPVLLLVYLSIGTWLLIRLMVKKRLGLGINEFRWMIVVVQVFALPCATIVHRSALYSDLRQLLFAAPGAALIATLGIWTSLGTTRMAARWGLGIRLAVAVMALVLPVVDQATLFPYNYAYSNVLTEAVGVHPPGDYYRASGRALVPSVPQGERVVCSPVIINDRAIRVSHLDGAQNCASALVSPISPYADKFASRQQTPRVGQFLALIFSTEGYVPENCTRINQVVRGYGWRRAIMSSLARCSSRFPILRHGVKVTARPAASWSFLDNGWYLPGIAGMPGGARARGDIATLGLRLSKDLSGKDVQLVLSAAYSGRLAASVNRVPVAASTSHAADAPRVVLDLPSRLTRGAYRHPLIVRLRRDDGQQMNLNLRALTMRTG